MPGDVSLARLIKDFGGTWVIEHTGASTAWVAVRRDAEGICISALMMSAGSGTRSRQPSERTRETTMTSDPGTHDVSCAQRIRWIRLAQAGDPVPPPAGLLKAIIAEIGSCCGHTPLRAHRLAFGWSVTAAVGALRGLRDPGVSRRAWQDWEAGKRPNRHNQDLLCRLFGTGPVELGSPVIYREGAREQDPAG